MTPLNKSTSKFLLRIATVIVVGMAFSPVGGFASIILLSGGGVNRRRHGKMLYQQAVIDD